MAIYQFAIAAGWNVALGSLTNVENLVTSDHRHFYPPDVFPGYDDGHENVRGDEMVSFNGFPGVPWRFSLFYSIQRYYLYHTINSDSNTGKVTINTLINKGDSSYTRGNAIMYLPPLSQSQKNYTNIGPYTVIMRGFRPL
jgi:hypothetical protein